MKTMTNSANSIILLAFIGVLFTSLHDAGTDAKPQCGLRWRTACKKSMDVMNAKRLYKESQKYDLNKIENEILDEVRNENRVLNDDDIRNVDSSDDLRQRYGKDDIRRLQDVGAELLKDYYDELKRATTLNEDREDEFLA